MIDYNKTDIKESLHLDQIFELLTDWGGEPEYTNFGILSATICHNEPGEGSRKLYFYENSGLFQCYTGCQGFFDIFELVIKVAEIQWKQEFDLNDAVRWIARRFGLSGKAIDEPDEDAIEDWIYLANYDRIQDISVKKQDIILKEYDSSILDRLNYTVKLTPWLKEGINEEALKKDRIGFYPGNDQITIPHYDANGRFVGLRGRTLCKEEAERYGKYRPIKINKQQYNHPLGMNLYGFNWAKENISIVKKAIVFESEKSVLMYMSYFGIENSIAVACCGSNLSSYQVQLLLDAGATEIIVAFDRQFQEIGDSEYKRLTKNLLKIHEKYKNYATISFIFDKNKITGYKASPIDEGPEKFLKLFQERIIL